MQSYAVIGSGALGALYGAMLARGGHDVHFLLRSDFDHVKASGWRIDSHWGSFTLPANHPHVHVYQQAKDIPACDVTIVGLKTTENARMASLLVSSTSGGGRVLVLQNGLGIESACVDVVGADRVMTGCCFLCSNKVGPGHIDHLDQGKIAMGRFSAPLDQVADQTINELSHAGIETKGSDDMLTVRWRKLLWNIPFNGLSVVLNASTSEIMACPSTVDLARRIIDEVADAAIASGRKILPQWRSQTIDVTYKMVPYDSSMRLDYRFGRPLEIEAIFNEPIRQGEKFGQPMPTVRAIRDQLVYRDTERMRT